MRIELRLYVILMIMIVALPGLMAFPQTSEQATLTHRLAGRWRVKFTLSGIGDKNLLFDAQEKGSGSFVLLDTGPDNKPVEGSVPAVWSETTNDRLSFSGNVELQLGACCREMGTVIFKGKFNSRDAISGRAIFIGSTVDEENFNGIRSTVGDFSAVRVHQGH